MKHLPRLFVETADGSLLFNAFGTNCHTAVHFVGNFKTQTFSQFGCKLLARRLIGVGALFTLQARRGANVMVGRTPPVDGAPAPESVVSQNSNLPPVDTLVERYNQLRTASKLRAHATSPPSGESPPIRGGASGRI